MDGQDNTNMALQPDIALGVKPPVALDFTKFAQLRNLASQDQLMQEQIATEQAQRPGIAADSEVKQRGLRFNDWMANNVDRFNNADGTMDHGKAVRAATAAGFTNEARALAKTDITNTGLAIKNVTDQTAADKAKLELGFKTLSYGGHFFSNLPEDKHGEYLDATEAQLNSMAPGTGTQFKNIVTLKNPDGSIAMDKAHRPIVDKSMVTALRLSGMTPETQERLAQAGSQSGTDADSRDPKSEKSRAYARAAIDAGVPGVVEGETSYTTLSTNQLFKELVAASVIPAELKAKGAMAVDDLKSDANRMGTTARLVEDLVASGDLSKGNMVSTLFNMKIDQVRNKPAHAAMVTLMQDLRARYPNLNPDLLDGPSMAAALRALQTTTMNGAGQKAQNLSKSTFNKVDTGTPPAAEIPRPEAPKVLAPAAALDALKKDPSLAPQFRAKYGYLP